MINETLPLLIIGASGFGKEVAWLAEECGVPVLGFIDDNESIWGENISGYPVLGDLNKVKSYSKKQVIIAIGNPHVRKQIVEKLKNIENIEYGTLVHPSAIMSKKVIIGEGSIICAGCILTVDISIGKHCHLNLASTIGHDSKINNYCTIAPQAIISGNVEMEACVEVGTGASIRQGIILASGSMLGMGGVLTKDTSKNTIYIGNPAKPFKKIQKL